MTEETRNLVLAIGLSLLVIIGWNFFFAQPKVESARQNQARIENNPTLPPVPAPPSPTTSPQAPAQQPSGTPPLLNATDPALPGAPNAALQPSRQAALAASPRIPIDTPSLSGSISLRGGRIDDLSLKGYRETTDPNSPNIVLLAPLGSPEPYFVNTGHVPQGPNITVPAQDTLWTAEGDRLSNSQPLTLTWDNGQGLVFHRKISVDDSFMFTIVDSVDNNGAASVALVPYSRAVRIGKPHVSGYAVLHEGFVGVIGDGRVQEWTYDGIDKETKATKTMNGVGGWAGFTDKYWAVALAPDQKSTVDASFSSSGETTKSYQTALLEQARTIAPGASDATTTHVFAGAKVTRTIDAYQAQYGIKSFDLIIDWGWFYFITKPLFWVIDYIYSIVGNFGVAIMIVTVMVKGVFFPLANKSYLSMAKMKNAQPQMVAIRERFPDDKARQQQELMELYKREKINPIAGCLPVVIQIPVFFALYKVIFITIEMRQAPFFGWIKDLSSPDPTNIFTLFGLIPYDPTHLPLIGPFLALGVWPLIMGVSMFIQMKMNPEPTDPIQKQMFAWMPVIFTFMLGAFPAGLVIYWTWNNLLSVTQQGLIMKRQGVKVELWDNLRNLFVKKPSAV
jgi:YidC/Oxa1 family membrane protein insertase